LAKRSWPFFSILQNGMFGSSAWRAMFSSVIRKGKAWNGIDSWPESSASRTRP
jgi:hypothetical protein